MNTVSETPSAGEITARLRRNTWRIATLALLGNAITGLAIWASVTTRAEAEIRSETAKLSDSYIRREAAVIQGASDAAIERTAQLRQTCRELQQAAGETQNEMNRLQAALTEKILQNERLEMSLDAARRAPRARVIQEPQAARQVAWTE